jgi:PilZ domain
MVALLKMPVPEFTSESQGAERRMFERKPANGVAQGHRVDHTVTARRSPRLCLDMRDVSMGGLAAMSDQPVQKGEQVSVVVPPRGLMGGWDAFGRVVRCEASTFGYRVAIEFDSLPAA